MIKKLFTYKGYPFTIELEKFCVSIFIIKIIGPHEIFVPFSFTLGFRKSGDYYAREFIFTFTIWRTYKVEGQKICTFGFKIVYQVPKFILLK